MARKIAAGEVIDRPYSVVRELLDNALDASATQVYVEWNNGGIDLVRVIDDGTGIHPNDLPLAVLPHATSKIASERDLNNLRSLGFRGEALASIAAVSRLEIHSATENEGGSLLTVRFGAPPSLSSQARSRGTSVSVQDIFLNLPARRKFLRSGRSEGLACRKTLEEKVLAFPEVMFSLIVDEQFVATYPAASLMERVKSLSDPALAPQLRLTEGGNDWIQLKAIYAPPEFFRRDRTGIYLFVNRRRINDFGLMQAVQYAFGDFLPGGSFPYCYLFLEIDPQEVDFNIHPAKREIRVRQAAALHQFLTRHLRSELKPLYGVQPQGYFSNKEPPPTLVETLDVSRQGFSYSRPLVLPNWAKELPPQDRQPLLEDPPSWRYLGQVLKLYLLVERQGKLIIVDQHAAHERINFDILRSRKGEKQRLLVPLEVNLDPQMVDFWKDRLAILESLGFQAELEKETLIVREVPALGDGFESEIIAYLNEPLGTERDLENAFYARMACRSSIMANEELDDAAARHLLMQVFRLEEPRCPHGRPLWIEVSEEELARLFGRTH